MFFINFGKFSAICVYEYSFCPFPSFLFLGLQLTELSAVKPIQLGFYYMVFQLQNFHLILAYFLYFRFSDGIFNPRLEHRKHCYLSLYLISPITGHPMDLILSSVVSPYYQAFLLTSLYTQFSFDCVFNIVLTNCGNKGETKGDVMFLQKGFLLFLPETRETSKQGSP